MDIKKQRNILIVLIILVPLIFMFSNNQQNKDALSTIIYRKEGSYFVFENSISLSDTEKIRALAPIFAYESSGVDFDDSIMPDYMICGESRTLQGEPAPPLLIYIWFQNDKVYISHDMLSKYTRLPVGIIEGYDKEQVEKILNK